MTVPAQRVSIVYDGQCPVCRHVVSVARLRGRTASLELIDARTDYVTAIQGNDLSEVDFDEGFAVIVDGRVHLGADGAQVLAGLAQRSGIGFRLFQCLVATEGRSRFWYPILRAGRKLLLRMLRVPRISDS